MRTNKAVVLAIILLFLSLIVPPLIQKSEAESATIVVPTDYSTIKEALTHAEDGNVVYVKKGTYQESNIIIDKLISIIGEDKESTIIIGQSSPFMLMVNHSQVTISGLTLIATNTKQPEVTALIFDREIVAIQIEQSQNCNISGNKIQNSGNGIWIHSSSYNIIEGNTIWDNYYGIDITGFSVHNLIRNNDISSSHVGLRFSDRNVNNTVVSANKITSAYTGLFYYFTSFNFVVGNYIAYNTDATHFVGSTKNVFHHNNFQYNSRDITNDSAYYDLIRVVKSINYWDDSREGNYWDKYRGTGSAPYIINEFNQDNHPLLNSVNIENYPSYSSTALPYSTSSQTPTSTAIIASNSPSPSPIPSPTIPEFPILVIISLLGSMLTGAIIVRIKKPGELVSREN
jgi:parallel beta-helix repeat protein